MYKKMAIFPIDYNTVTLARYAYIGNYEVIALLAPALNVLEGNDISRLDGGRAANIQLYSDYMQKISCCDVIYFANSGLIHDLKIYRELIEYAKELSKEIIIADSLLARLDNVKDSLLLDDFLSLKLLTIETPIISVFTLGDNCGQSQTELSLRKYFLNKDYRVMYIGTQEYSNIIGGINFPTFLYDSALDAQEKIIKFNKFVHERYLLEKPDLILLGVPNPIMKYNDNILNGFGIIPFIIHNAIKSDIGIVNLYFGDYTYEYLDQVMQFCKYRFGVPTKYFSISNTHVSKNIDDVRKLEYLYLDTDFVKAGLNMEIEKNDFTVFTSYDEESMSRAFLKIEDELLSNPNQI